MTAAVAEMAGEEARVALLKPLTRIITLNRVFGLYIPFLEYSWKPGIALYICWCVLVNLLYIFNVIKGVHNVVTLADEEDLGLTIDKCFIVYGYFTFTFLY